MVIFYEVVDATYGIEEKPDNNHRSKGGTDARDTKRLDSEKEDENSAGNTNDGGS